MSVGENETTGAAPWEITRFEFVYFNRRHKRWQIWQELPQPASELTETGSAQPLYRRQFHQLLRIIRDCFQALLTDLDDKNRFVMPIPLGDSLQFIINPDDVLGKNLPFWKGFLGYCSNSLAYYGARSPDLEQFLIDPHLGDFKAGHPSHEIKRKEALDLISILPILRDWDLFGCWYRAWINELRVDSDNWAFPPSQASAGGWIEPFYVARLRYTTDPSPAGSPLNNNIPTQAICSDLGAGANSLRLVFPERDFFDPIYCTTPTDENLLLYRAYAYLYDRLQQALASNTSFIISYPVVCLSRTHFLQIQITRSGDAEASVDDLWRDWMDTIHPLFWTPHTKQFLSEELQRISLSTFQAMWSRSLQKRFGSGTAELRVGDLIDTFCEQAYALVPLRAIEHGGKKWSYQRYDTNDAGVDSWLQMERRHSTIPADSAYGDLGAKWRSEVVDPNDSRQDGIGISWERSELPGLTLFLSSRYSTELERTIQEGRAIQIAYQQMEFGNQLLDSAKEEVRRAQTAEREARAAVYAYFSNPLSRLKYQPGLGGEVSVPESVFRVSKMDFEHVTKIGWPDQEELQRELQRLAAMTVPLEASQILEIGAVKALTHPGGNYWTGELSSAVRYLNDLECRCPDFADGNGLEAKRWKEDLPTFIRACIVSAQQNCTITDTEALESYDRLRGERIWTSLFTDWTLELDHTPYSFRPCFPVWEVLNFFEIKRAIDEYSDGERKLAAFALPIAPVPVSQEEPWAHTSPQLFRNVFCCRYRLKTPAPDSWGRFVSAKLWARLAASGLARYGSLYLGARDADRQVLVDRTQTGDPVAVRLEDILPCADYLPYMNEIFQCEPEQVIVALAFDTWRTKT